MDGQQLNEYIARDPVLNAMHVVVCCYDRISGFGTYVVNTLHSSTAATATGHWYVLVRTTENNTVLQFGQSR